MSKFKVILRASEIPSSCVTYQGNGIFLDSRHGGNLQVLQNLPDSKVRLLAVWVHGSWSGWYEVEDGFKVSFG